ncbi:hypothetical protein [Paenibacillus sp.]|jgi:hypothetical protein|uniref:hypothetical protein n=1 Tax=Paenibacillus sp. TaxID=58172 RepID=UPI0028272FA7|nr:hypothetical protein [Paenibacillus sp.]MDR0267340.1 hypothetical protein [Paenibacillus sp.]
MNVRKWSYIVIALLLVTNGVTLGLLLQNNGKLPGNGNRWEAFTLNGKGQKWQVNDYKVIRTSFSIFHGKGSLTYLGNPQDIKDSTYFDYTYFKLHDGEPWVINSNSASSPNASVDILANIKHLGSIEGAPSPWEPEDTAQGLLGSYMEVNWKDNQGQLHTEQVPMSVTEEFSGKE